MYYSKKTTKKFFDKQSSMTDATMLKSDARTFSYEQIKVENVNSAELKIRNEKKQAISFQFSLSIETNLIKKIFLDLAASK